MSLALGLLAAPDARAQACHVAAANDDGVSRARLSARMETAGFETTRYEGHYQGLFAGLLVASEAFSGEASVPLYRIVRNGLREQGFGDVALGGRARLLTFWQDRGALGAFVALTLPTGDREKDLGMGHVMVMPGVFARARFAPFAIATELAYGASIGAAEGEHHEHAAAGESPIVSPMNDSELEPLVAMTLALTDTFGVRGGAYGGFPLREGAARAVAFLGLDATRGAFGARVHGQLPLAGDPFTSKLVLELSAGF